MKKGFTLIELLAVIIILAILMIIAVPNILSTLATARSSAFITQAQSVYKASEQQYIIDTMSGSASNCYDKNNLNLGSISSTISFAVQMNSSTGTVSSLIMSDSGQQLKVSGTSINNIGLTTYANETLSCSGSTSNTSQTPTIYTESLLNGADPVISGDLIPVVLSQDNTDGWKVVKADTTSEWYKYGQSRWANAVRLVSSPSQTYSAGDTIAHSDISAYFVWIPKYRYKIFYMGNEANLISTKTSANKLIEIEFGTSNTTDTSTSCATSMESATSGNCAVGKWMTHPAFISLNKNGIWVGKFETNGTTTDVNNQTTITSMTVLPGIEPLINCTVGEMFLKALSYDGTGANAALDSHMMKNTEWGAVAYLAHSSYGMGNKNIYKNNYSNNWTRKTGCVGNSATANAAENCVNQWYSTNGFNGSTSGNITGIYDMNGGVWEFVASFRDTNSNIVGSSGLVTSTIKSEYSKYIDVYDNTYDSYADYASRILGDATGEMGPFQDYYNSWYDNLAWFVVSNGPWFIRGCHSDCGGSGLTSFSSSEGGKSGESTLRLVLAP